MLYNHHLVPPSSKAFSHLTQIKRHTHQAISHSPSPSPLARTHLLSVFMDLLIYKWNHTVCALLCLAAFTEHHVFEVCLLCGMFQCSIPFYGCIIFRCMDTLHFAYSSVKTFVLLPHFGCCKYCCDKCLFTWCWERLKAGEKGMTEDEMLGWHH